MNWSCAANSVAAIDMKLSSRRPYLIRAMYEWLADNELTPHIIIDSFAPGVKAPPQEANQDGRLVLNISMRAVRDLDLGNQRISFNARFAGVAQHIVVPVAAVLAIYARENNEGLAFPEGGDLAIDEQDADDDDGLPQPKSVSLSLASAAKKPQLSAAKLVSDDGGVAADSGAGDEAASDTANDTANKTPKRARPQLKVIK